jgi:hypothetical protein
MITFEEFKELALNPPTRNEKATFTVEVYLYVPEQSKYPEFDIYSGGSYCFPTFQQAEERIRKIASEFNNGYTSLYCFYIHRDLDIQDCSDHDKSWMYDEKGNLVAETYAPLSPGENLLSRFRGRPEESILFHPGDIVELVNGKGVTLGIVVHEPPSIECAWELYQGAWKRNMEFYSITLEKAMELPFLDSVDDCYYCFSALDVDEDDHWHQNTLCISKPHLKVPESARKMLTELYLKRIVSDHKKA